MDRRLCRPREPRQGFTLIEMIVVMTIIVAMATAGLRFLSQMKTSAEPGITNRLLLQIEGRRVADQIIEHLREGTEIIRPTLGETSPYVLFLDPLNRLNYLYLTGEEKNSRLWKKTLYSLLWYEANDTGTFDPGKERVFSNMVKEAHFTLSSPNCVQASITLENEKGEYQFLTQIGLMNLGD